MARLPGYSRHGTSPGETLVFPVEVPIVQKQSSYRTFWQALRFGIVGVLNTGVDFVTFSLLTLLFSTQNIYLLVGYNTVAFLVGALNSFLLNKYWTFSKKLPATRDEVIRFAILVFLTAVCNDGLVWLAATLLHSLSSYVVLWADLSKAFAIVGTAVASYLGMRFWVFSDTITKRLVENPLADATHGSTSSYVEQPTNTLVATDHAVEKDLVSLTQYESIDQTFIELLPFYKESNTPSFLTDSSLSIILPAHNEEQLIVKTVQQIITTLAPWVEDFEVIVVNDGSTDRTQNMVEELALVHPYIRLLSHSVNQGYGAALVTGFEAVSKDLAFFTDSDGQFAIEDLASFFPLIQQYDAVLGYRIDRQDSWMRKLNAWGWKMLVTVVFKISVHDVDCAFKLFRADFFREQHLETRGAMINTEILYKMKRAGYTFSQVGVNHLPRTSGQATGAKLSVILRAFRELFTYAQKWHREERAAKKIVV